MLSKKILFCFLIGYLIVTLAIFISMLIYPKKNKVIDMKEIVCVTEKTKCKIIWVKDKAMVEKLLQCKWEELYYYLYPIDILGNSVVFVPWRPLKHNSDGLFRTDKEFKRLPPQIKPETNLKFYNPNTKEYVVFTIDLSNNQYRISEPKKDPFIDTLLVK
ncbi:MAG TPA: hypothetical protein PK747_05745 [Acidobacteriota bacterium]|nr:hypothetical protein [Acidobacteriota bacterium]HNT18455.1 hypothetical protein [Acidobacteriota bacterium]HQO20261.1 hypothetical protein [Acidobacteriota bacterium]HQQ46896.1 hypothetical protein [Acidobacteriota bacterium]